MVFPAVNKTSDTAGQLLYSNNPEVFTYNPGVTPEVQVMPAGNVSLPWRVLVVPYRQP